MKRQVEAATQSTRAITAAEYFRDRGIVDQAGVRKVARLFQHDAEDAEQFIVEGDGLRMLKVKYASDAFQVTQFPVSDDDAYIEGLTTAMHLALKDLESVELMQALDPETKKTAVQAYLWNGLNKVGAFKDPSAIEAFLGPILARKVATEFAEQRACTLDECMFPPGRAAEKLRGVVKDALQPFTAGPGSAMRVSDMLERGIGGRAAQAAAWIFGPEKMMDIWVQAAIPELIKTMAHYPGEFEAISELYEQCSMLVKFEVIEILAFNREFDSLRAEHFPMWQFERLIDNVEETVGEAGVQRLIASALENLVMAQVEHPVFAAEINVLLSHGSRETQAEFDRMVEVKQQEKQQHHVEQCQRIFPVELKRVLQEKVHSLLKVCQTEKIGTPVMIDALCKRDGDQGRAFVLSAGSPMQVRHVLTTASPEQLARVSRSLSGKEVKRVLLIQALMRMEKAEQPGQDLAKSYYRVSQILHDANNVKTGAAGELEMRVTTGKTEKAIEAFLQADVPPECSYVPVSQLQSQRDIPAGTRARVEYQPTVVTLQGLFKPQGVGGAEIAIDEDAAVTRHPAT